MARAWGAASAISASTKSSSCVEGRDTCERRLDQIERRQLSGRNHACGVGQCQVRKIDHASVPPRRATDGPAIVPASIQQGEAPEPGRATVRDIVALLGAIGVFFRANRSRVGNHSAAESTRFLPSQSDGRNFFNDSDARYQRSYRQRAAQAVPNLHGLSPLSTRTVQCAGAATGQSVFRVCRYRHGST